MSTASDTGSEESTADESEGRAAAVPEVPPGSDSLIGRVIAGRYTLESLLGTGPIGHTFRAKRSDDGSLVALKILLPLVRDDAEFTRRFARDVDATRELDEHRHIARISELGRDDELGPFVARELVEGEHLVAALRRGALTPRRICELLIQALSAVSEAHRHGILHRDLKPQNILVFRENGRECIKLCDFAHALNKRPSAEYMAPEQGAGLPVDGQIDVYAVGVILYELLTGDVPFRADTPAQTLALHLSGTVVPPREKRPDLPLPRELEAVCLKALAKDPRVRHRSPREMSQALRAVISLLGARADEPLGSSAFGEGSGVVAPTASTERMTMPGEQLRSSTKFWVGAALVAVVCVAVFMKPNVQRPTGDPEPAPQAGERGRGGHELASGILKLQAGDTEGAVVELQKARRALGETPEVLRALGEALIIQGSHSDGVALLTRYLELEPAAPDREFVEALVRRSKQRK